MSNEEKFRTEPEHFTYEDLPYDDSDVYKLNEQTEQWDWDFLERLKNRIMKDGSMDESEWAEYSEATLQVILHELEEVYSGKLRISDDDITYDSNVVSQNWVDSREEDLEKLSEELIDYYEKEITYLKKQIQQVKNRKLYYNNMKTKFYNSKK